jgi:hypothetical protein
MGDDDTMALVCEQRGDLGERIDVIGPAVEQKDGRSVAGSEFGVSDTEVSRVDLSVRDQPMAILSGNLLALASTRGMSREDPRRGQSECDPAEGPTCEAPISKIAHDCFSDNGR